MLVLAAGVVDGCDRWVLLMIAGVSSTGRCCWWVLVLGVVGVGCWLRVLLYMVVSVADGCCWLVLVVGDVGRC